MSERHVHRIECEPEHLILAARAIKYGLGDMPNDSALVCYGEGVTFLVLRTKRGVSVKQVPTP